MEDVIDGSLSSGIGALEVIDRTEMGTECGTTGIPCSSSPTVESASEDDALSGGLSVLFGCMIACMVRSTAAKHQNTGLGSKSRKHTEIVSNVEASWARIPDGSEVLLTSSVCTRVHELSSCQDHKLIEESDDVATRLMDCKDDGTIEILRQ